MKPAFALLAAALALSACNEPAPPPAPAKAAVGTGLRTGEYWCYAAGGVVLGNQGFVIPEPGKYQDVDGRNPGAYTVADGQVSFSGGHFDKSVGRNLHDDTFRIGTAMECAPKP